MPDQESGASGPAALTGAQVKELHHELKALNSDRNSNYQMRRDMYAGRHWGQPGLPSPIMGQKRYTLVANYTRTTADKAVHLLLGQMPAIQVLPPGVDEDARRKAEGMEALIYATWNRNEAPITLRRVAFNMTLLGTGIVYYWWDSKAKTFKFRSIAPDNFYPLYDGEEIVECVIVSRRSTRILQRQYPKQAKEITPDEQHDDSFDEDSWARQNGASGSTYDPLSSGVATHQEGPRATPLGALTTVYDWFDKWGNHVRVMGEATHTQKLGYQREGVPVIMFPHSMNGDEREPRTEIDEVIDLNLYLDDLLSDQANVIRKFARPTIIDKGSGVSPETVSNAIQREGGILPIRKDGEIMFLNWEGTPPDFVNQYNRVLALIYDLSGKPPSAYGQLVSNQSGVATNMAQSPVTASTEERTSIFGFGLRKLNAAILQLNEVFMKGEQIDVRGTKPTRAGVKTYTFYQAMITGADIDGWRENTVRWPSALRTDDPVYVQNELAKMQSQPPAQSVYTTLENLGIEDSEMELDRIKEQLEDPRFHPDRLKTAVDAATQLQNSAVPSGMEGLDPAMASGNIGAEEANMNLRAAGNPNREQMLDNGY